MKVRYRETSFAVSLLIGDIFMILTALRFSFWLKFESGWVASKGLPDFQIYAQAFALVMIFTVLLFRLYGLYTGESVSSYPAEFALIAKAISIATVLVMSLSFFFRDVTFSRAYLVIAWVHMIVLVPALRFVQGFLYMAYRRANGKFKDVLMVGASPVSARLALNYQRQPRWCTRVCGILDDRVPEGERYKQIPVMGKVGELEAVLRDNPNINEVMVVQKDLPHDEILKIMNLTDKFLVNFKWCPDMLGLVATQMKINYEFGMPLLAHKESPLLEWENRALKRAMDATLSALFLVLGMPVWIVIGLIVKLGSRGPVFYKQKRVGEDGKSFTLYKFRTMIENAESATGPVWAKTNDSRRTGFGTFLRRTNLDEIPQIWNVLKGDMSLVGPRPERPHFVGQFKENIPRYMGRHQIKSGLTGWAQVHGLRGDTSIEERTKYDLFYIENWSVMLDLRILFKTFSAFKNAY